MAILVNGDVAWNRRDGTSPVASPAPHAPQESQSGDPIGRAQQLRAVGLFESLPEADLRTLAEAFVEVVLEKKAAVYRQEEASEGLFVLQKGCVTICRAGAGETLEPLARLGAGDYFGEAGLFDGHARAETALCEEECRLLRIDRAPLLAFLEDRPLLTLQLQLAAARAHTVHAKTSLAIAQRRAVRHRIEETVRLTTAGGGSRDANLVDVSPLGLQLEGAPEDWRQGEIVRFGMDWSGSSLLLRGRIAWRRKQAVGLAFQHPSPSGEAQMQQAVGRLLDLRAGSRL